MAIDAAIPPLGEITVHFQKVLGACGEILLVHSNGEVQHWIGVSVPASEGERTVKTRVGRVPDMIEGHLKVVCPFLARPSGAQVFYLKTQVVTTINK